MSDLVFSTLNIGAWNIDSLFTRISNIRTCKFDIPQVSDKLKEYDIFCLSETHCSPSDKFDFEGYHLVQNFRPKSARAPRAFGGLLIGIKHSIFKGVTFMKHRNSEFMWFKLDKLFFGLHSDIYVCSLYISPANSSYSFHRDDIFTLIEEDIVKFSAVGDCLLVGDFNARTSTVADFIENDLVHHGIDIAGYVVDTPLHRNNKDNHCIDTHGKSLIDLCKGSNMRILNGRKLGDLQGHFTCYNHIGQPSVIDYMICSTDLFSNITFFHVNDLTPHSIHCMISCHMQVNLSSNICDEIPLNDPPSQFIWNANSPYLWHTMINQQSVKTQFDEFTNDINDDQDVDDLVLRFNDIIYDVSKKAGIHRKRKNSVPVSKKSVRKIKKWYDNDCKTLYDQLSSVIRCFRRDVTNTYLLDRYRHLKKKYKKLLNYKKSEFRNCIFSKLDTLQSKDPKAFWNLYNDMCDTKSTSNNIIPPIEWWNHFNSLMNRNLLHSDPELENLVDNVWLNFSSQINEDLDYEISIEEVTHAISNLKNKKAPGLDCIRNEMLKSASNVLAPVLTKLFNVILKSGNFPESWRLSALTVIHKKGDKCNPKNYRGIAVSSNLCKLFCLILHARLTNFCDAHNIIPNEQIGFRKGSRTQDHIFTLKHLIDKYLKLNKNLYVCFVDFSSAFDTIWRNGLIYKLIHSGVDGNFIKIIHSMYSSVQFTVKCSDKITDSFQSSVGVKQGCVLSPLFFNIYLRDLPLIFDNNCDPVTLNEAPLSCLMYADDLVLLSQSEKGLQTSLDKLYDYCVKWKLCVNNTKTKVMIFNKSGRMLNNHVFKYDNNLIELCNEYCYLGILFTPSGSFTKTINYLKDKATKAFFKIRENLYSSSSKCSIKLFNSLIKPILCYGCEIWAPYILKNLKDDNFINICDKITSETLHVKTCKLILGVSRKTTNNAVRGELGSYPLLLFMLCLSLKYWWSLNNDCLLGSSTLVIQTLLENRVISTHNTNNTFFTWSSGIKNICKLIDMEDVWSKPNILFKSSLSQLVTNKLQSIYDSQWLSYISSFQPKLRTYCKFKTSFNCENYLIIFNRSQRLSFSKLRVSAHKLLIEAGRHTIPRIQPNDRICKQCNLNEVEDEFHFIMHCKLYDNLRSNFMSELNDIIVTTNYSEEDFFITIMSAKDTDILKVVLNFVNLAFKKRFGTT